MSEKCYRKETNNRSSSLSKVVINCIMSKVSTCTQRMQGRFGQEGLLPAQDKTVNTQTYSLLLRFIPISLNIAIDWGGHNRALS